MTPARGAVEVAGTREAAPFGAARSASALRQKTADYLLLVKFRLSLMVLASGLVGFWIASNGSPDLGSLAAFGAGTFLVVAAANAFNQVRERAQDGMMRRTARRPLPAGRMRVGEATAAALVFSGAGTALLLAAGNLLTALLGVVSLLVYVAVYTPLKRRTPWATVAGAVSGATPPLMGWAMVRGGLEAPAWILFGIVFLWQFPHTWAIATAYGEDYLRAGYRILSPLELSGSPPGLKVISFCAGLLVVSTLPYFQGTAGGTYLAGTLVLGLMLLGSAVRFSLRGTRRLALELMTASLVYMPILLALLALDYRGW